MKRPMPNKVICHTIIQSCTCTIILSCTIIQSCTCTIILSCTIIQSCTCTIILSCTIIQSCTCTIILSCTIIQSCTCTIILSCTIIQSCTIILSYIPDASNHRALPRRSDRHWQGMVLDTPLNPVPEVGQTPTPLPVNSGIVITSGVIRSLLLLHISLLMKCSVVTGIGLQ